MSAAFALDFSGDPVPCDYPGCTLDAFHEGEHRVQPKPGIVLRHYDRHCVVCGCPFTIYGANGQEVFSTCGQPECVLHFARHGNSPLPVTCRCPQRDYPHELAIHFDLRSESFNPKFRFRWPWSLMLSSREEPSTERKTAS